MAYNAKPYKLINKQGNLISLVQVNNLSNGYEGANVSVWKTRHSFIDGYFNIDTSIYDPNLLPLNVTQTYRYLTLANGNYVDMTRAHDMNPSEQVELTLRFYLADGTQLTHLGFGYRTAAGYPYTFLCFAFIEDESENVGRASSGEGGGFSPSNVYNSILSYPDAATKAEFLSWINGAEQDEDDPYQFAPQNDEEGGWGTFDYSSEDDDIPTLPTLSATDAGFCSLYKMTGSQVKDLADYLWGLGSLASFLPLFSNPMECILSLGIVPCDPSSTSSYNIKVGNLTTTVQGALIDSQYIEVNCGDIEISGKRFTNNFMNYSPYTKVELYLPYIGTVSLNIDEIMDSIINITYHIDLLSGSCVAYVKVAKYYNGDLHTNVLYQYSGNVLTNIPITSQNFTQVLQAVIGAVASGADKAAGAGLKGGMSQGMDDGVNSVESFKPHVQRSGNMSSSCGLMGEQTPKLVLSLPHLVKANNQGKQLGYPRYQEYTLNQLKGYTTCYKVHLSGFKCTDAEREEIISLLTSGVVLPTSDPAAPTLSGSNNIGVYTYSAEKIALDKKTGLTQIDIMEGYFREDCDVLNPVITIQPTNTLTAAKILTEANYIYLKDFGRCYYITRMTAKAGGLIEVELHVDVLMSWAAAIRSQTVIVDRNEQSCNLMLTDGAIRTSNDPYTVVMHPSGGTGFSTPHFILAVAGSPA